MEHESVTRPAHPASCVLPATHWSKEAAISTLEVSLRPVAESDLDFLGQLYASTREQEMAGSGWPLEAIAEFLAEQFGLQHRYYRSLYADGEFLMVERVGWPIGRLYLQWCAQHLQLIDITLLAQVRGCGIGKALLGVLMAQADARGLATVLHVEVNNPVRHWYSREGFGVIAENGIYLKMQRPACDRPLPQGNRMKLESQHA